MDYNDLSGLCIYAWRKHLQAFYSIYFVFLDLNSGAS